jgi:hypothetical protein
LSAAPSDRRSRVPAWALWTGGTVALAAFLWICDMASGVNPWDADWFAQLSGWVAHGDALYSERFYGVMPLAVWLAVPGMLVFGTQVAVVKALCAGSSAGAALFATYAARRLGVGPAGQALVVLASVAYLVLPSYAPYQPMASAAEVGALAAMAAWIGQPAARPRRELLLAGTAAGISIASKQTVGTLTLAACLAVVWLAPRPTPAAPARRINETGVLLAPALAIPVLSLAPILFAAHLDAFWRYAVTKGAYVDRGSVSYLHGFQALGNDAGLPPANLHLFLLYLGNVWTPLAVIGLAATVRRTAEWVLLASFTVAAIAMSYPRADLLVTIPTVAVALAWSARQLAAGRVPFRAQGAALIGIAVLLGITCYATLLRSTYIDIRDGYGIGGIRGHAGVAAQPALVRAAGEIGGELAAVDDGQDRTFVLSRNAGFIYLVSGVHDPTRQDYPFATTFRGDERRALESTIASGEIPRVCLGDYKGTGRLRPWGLESFIRSRLRRAERVGPPAGSPFAGLGCRIYRSPAAD